MGDKGETGGSAQMLEEAVGVATVTQGAREGAAEMRAQTSPRPWALKNREKGTRRQRAHFEAGHWHPTREMGYFSHKTCCAQNGPGSGFTVSHQFIRHGGSAPCQAGAGSWDTACKELTVWYTHRDSHVTGLQWGVGIHSKAWGQSLCDVEETSTLVTAHTTPPGDQAASTEVTAVYQVRPGPGTVLCKI